MPGSPLRPSLRPFALASSPSPRLLHLRKGASPSSLSRDLHKFLSMSPRMTFHSSHFCFPPISRPPFLPTRPTLISFPPFLSLIFSFLPGKFLFLFGILFQFWIRAVLKQSFS